MSPLSYTSTYRDILNIEHIAHDFEPPIGLSTFYRVLAHGFPTLVWPRKHGLGRCDICTNINASLESISYQDTETLAELRALRETHVAEMMYEHMSVFLWIL
jgi:hypothetical protein